MLKATTTDISLTKSYIPKVSKIPGISPTIVLFYKPIENRNIHEERVVDQAYYKSNNIERLFTNIRFNCLFQINKLIVPRFILDFYSQVTGPYCTNLPTLDDIRQLLELERVVEELIWENVFRLGGHQDRLPACLAHMLYCVVAEEQYNLAYFFVKRIECARANPTANLPYGMFLTCLYRHVMETYPHLDNGIYDIVERVMHPLALKHTRRPRSDRGKARHSISSSSSHHQGTSSHQHDDDDDDVKTSRASTLSPTTYLISLNPLNYQNYQMPSSSEQTDETLFERQTTLLNWYETDIREKDEKSTKNDKTEHGMKKREKTKSTKVKVKVNSAKSQQSKSKPKSKKYDTKTPSPKLQLSPPNAPNAPSKIPSTKDTSSSSIDYIPKSPTSSTSISPNGYLNPPTSPPQRVSSPHPTQKNASMDITLTISPITSLDVQFDTPSPSPPIFGHPIPWNLLEAHGDSCFCLLEGYTDASWINNTEDDSTTSGWVFLLGGGAISRASLMQTCITSLTMKYEFVAFADVGKEAERLKCLILDISLWLYL
ncbi:hypothetical protein Tco_0770322 [Tanacetum coccineum]|uniref:Uncharacterized protein n=1 Tax=Tanacetum coccineum TaxID=301880 RepID=A0ABQ4ZDU1_9ASTR